MGTWPQALRGNCYTNKRFDSDPRIRVFTEALGKWKAALSWLHEEINKPSAWETQMCPWRGPGGTPRPQPLPRHSQSSRRLSRHGRHDMIGRGFYPKCLFYFCTHPPTELGRGRMRDWKLLTRRLRCGSKNFAESVNETLYVLPDPVPFSSFEV